MARPSRSLFSADLNRPSLLDCPLGRLYRHGIYTGLLERNGVIA